MAEETARQRELQLLRIIGQQVVALYGDVGGPVALERQYLILMLVLQALIELTQQLVAAGE